MGEDPVVQVMAVIPPSGFACKKGMDLNRGHQNQNQNQTSRETTPIEQDRDSPTTNNVSSNNDNVTTAISADATLLLTFSSSSSLRCQADDNKDSSNPDLDLDLDTNLDPDTNPDPDPPDAGDPEPEPAPTPPARKRLKTAPSWYDKPFGDLSRLDPLDPSDMSYHHHLQESHLRRSLEESLRADGWIPQNERPSDHFTQPHHAHASSNAFPAQAQACNGSEVHSSTSSSGYFTPTYPSSALSSRPSSVTTHRPSNLNGSHNLQNQQLPSSQPNTSCYQPVHLGAAKSSCCPDDTVLPTCHDQHIQSSQNCSPFSQEYFPQNHIGQPYPLCNTPVAPCDTGCDTGCDGLSCVEQLAAAGAACHETHCELPLCTTPDCEQQLPCVDPCLDFDCIEEACNQPQQCEGQVCTTPDCPEPPCPPCTTCNLEQICPQCPPGHHPSAGHIHHATTQQPHQWQQTHCPPTAVCSDTQPGQTAHCWDDCNFHFPNDFHHDSQSHGDCSFDHVMAPKWPAMPTFQANAHHHMHGMAHGQYGQHDWGTSQHCTKKHKHDNAHHCHASHGHCDINDLFGSHVYDTLAAQAHGMSSQFNSTTPSIHDGGSDIFSDNDPLTSLSNEAARRTPLPSRQKRKGVDGDIAYDEATDQHICRWALDGYICSQPFSTPKELRDHIFEAHTARGKARDDTGGIVCRWNNCGRGGSTNTEETTFRDGVKLEVHFCSHAGYKKFACQYCPDAFITKSQLDNHLKTHTGARPFLCPYPDCTSKITAFATKTGLSTHIRSQHQKAKPFKCKFEGCVSEFADSSNRTKHHRDVHNAGNSMPCPKEGCEYRDTRAEGLRTHCKRVHAEDAEVVAMLGDDTRTPAWVRWVECHKAPRRRSDATTATGGVRGGDAGGSGGVARGVAKGKAGKRKKGEVPGKGQGGANLAQPGLPDLMPLVTAVNGSGGMG